MTEQQVFKTCQSCQTTWKNVIDLVLDQTLEVNGYQAAFDHPENGIIFFTHNIKNCHSTLAINVMDFKDFYCGPRINHHNTGLHTCTGLCLMRNNLENCTAICDMQWVREVLQYLRKHEIPLHLKNING
jgi:hypothetical protein